MQVKSPPASTCWTTKADDSSPSAIAVLESSAIDAASTAAIRAKKRDHRTHGDTQPERNALDSDAQLARPTRARPVLGCTVLLWDLVAGPGCGTWLRDLVAIYRSPPDCSVANRSLKHHSPSEFGPPNLTKSRSFELTFALEI